MGLDVTAYSKVKKIDCLFNQGGDAVDPITREELDHNSYVLARVNPDFPGREGRIEDGACYSFEDADRMHGGSYGGYNRWRDQLAEMAGYPKQINGADGRESHCVACWNGEDGVFSELINFSDCEGVIGSEASARLAKEFSDYQEKADLHTDSRFQLKYAEWRKMFELASDGGFVDFY